MIRKLSVFPFLVAVCALLLSACAETKGVFRYVESEHQQVWPTAPDVPRYRYVGQLTGEQNFYVESEGGVGEAFVTALKWVAGIFSSNARKANVLQRPQTGVVGEDGRIFVTDVSRQAVFVFDRQQGKLEIWEEAAKNTGFLSPIGIAVGRDGEILVADSELGVIAKLDKQGKPAGTYGGGVLKRPTGVARDPVRGWIYISDTHDHNIKVFNDAGHFVKVIGQRGEADGQFNGPTFLTFSSDRLYVSDTLNARVQVFNGEGEFVSSFGRRGLYIGDMPHPKGVAADSDGNIYVVESYYDHLLIYNDAGQLLLPIGGTGHAIGQFYLPSGVWIDNNDRVHVSDMFNGRVMILQFLKAGSQQKDSNIAPVPPG